MKRIIDLSEHNGEVNFAKIRQEGITSVILRLGWIGNKQNHTIDKRFNEYFSQAKLYGFNVGVYVFNYCKNLDTLKQGIKWTLDLLQNKVLELPVFIDIEDDPQSNSYLSKIGRDTLTRMCILWCKEIEDAGFIGGIYANKNFFENYIYHSLVLDYKLWWAEYNNGEKPSSHYKVDLWQYTSKGKVNGINGNVDISYCMCKCDDTKEKPIENVKEEFEMKNYVNGSTKEIVYEDIKCTKQIGYLNPREQCKCYGIIDNKALIVYDIDNSKGNKKTGFVKWLGGVK